MGQVIEFSSRLERDSNSPVEDPWPFVSLHTAVCRAMAEAFSCSMRATFMIPRDRPRLVVDNEAQ